MKVQRLVDGWALWNYVSTALPSSLVAMKRAMGYGYCGLVYRHDKVPGKLAQIFEFTGDPVALVTDSMIELFEPQYFSDFEDLCRKYEESTKREVTLRYWEGR